MNYSIGLVRRGSTQIEIPSLPRSLTATRYGFSFYVAQPPSLHPHGYDAPRSRRVVTVTPENRDEVFPAI